MTQARERFERWGGLAAAVVRLALLALVMVAGSNPAAALKVISVTPDQERIEITSLGDYYESRGDSLQLEMAAASDAVGGRMTVRAANSGTNPAWVAFALQNATDKPIERWLTAERYTMIGSGAIWPDLDAKRIEAVTPSLGFIPERIKSERADIFRITLEPGQTITYVAELSTERFARVYLWKPIDYELKARDRQLFNGVLLGLTGLLAIFLTAVFAANHQAIFPSAALVAWCVLFYLTVDFGLFHKLFQLRADENALYRAATESATAASFVIFLQTFLRLTSAPSLIRLLLTLWTIGQLSLVAIAVVDPRLASTFARLSFVGVAAVGGVTTAFLALRGRDRALALVPTWMLFIVWVLGAAVTLTGRLSTELAAAGLVAGLVLIVVLIGFTVTQFAFRSLEPQYGRAVSADGQISALAVDGAGAAIVEWQPQRGEMTVSPVLENILGLQQGELSAKLGDVLKHVHEADRERVRMLLSSVRDRSNGNLRFEFRLRHADGTARWFDFDASSVPSPDPRAVRYVGLVRDITDGKRVYERLVHDGIACSLTGLANRVLFLDRLAVVMQRARTDESVRPAVILIDIDRFKQVNATLGNPAGDGLLLTIARRLQRQVGPPDTLARVGGDQFAVLYPGEKDAGELAREAEKLRRAVRAPIKLGGQDIVLSCSIGIAIFDGEEGSDTALLDEAEIAMMRAKRAGHDKVELFRPVMRADREQTREIEAELAQAVEQNQLKVLYQPLIYLPTEELAGFEAILSWDHPKLGTLDPFRQLPASVAPELVGRVGAWLLARATQDAARWQKELPRLERPLFVAINVTAPQILKGELVREAAHVLDRAIIPRGTLRLEVAESVVMENPEQALDVLTRLDEIGVELTLDEFGAGFSSLAYLQRMPFDTIKIDRAFIQAAGGGEADEASVVRSMVALSHELNRRVVADGVEDPQDAAFLRGIGCSYAQGFYYGDPMPEKEVLQLLKLVRKSETQHQPRGLFKLTMKRPKRVAGSASAAPPAPAKAGGDKTGRPKQVRGVNGGANGQAPGKPGGQAGVKPVAANGAGFDPSGPPHMPASPPPMPPHGHVQLMQGGPGHGGAPHAMGGPQYYYDDPMAGGDPHAGYAPPVHAPMPEPAQINPLSSLQAGLQMLNLKARVASAAPAARTGPQAPVSVGDAAPDQLARGLAQVLAAASHVEPMPSAMAPAPVMPSPAPAPVMPASPPVMPAPRPVDGAGRQEGMVRVRPVRPPPDLSKLPPGLAASLAKLAGTPGEAGKTEGIPPPPWKKSGDGS